MKTLNLYVGEGFWSARFIRDMLDNGAIQGATVIPSRGYWTHPDTGAVVVESAEVIVLLAEDDKDAGLLVLAARNHAGKHTNEHSIMVDFDGTVSFHEAIR